MVQMQSPEALWWTGMPNPARFIRAVVNALNESAVAIVHGMDKLPWPETLLDEVEQAMASLQLRTERIGAGIPLDADAGQYVLEQFASRDIVAGFRPHWDVVEYLSQHKLLHGRLFFIQCRNLGTLQQWYRLFYKYNQKAGRNSRAYACLQYGSELTGVPYPTNLQLSLHCEDLTNETILFTGLLAAHQQYPKGALDYVARLAASLACGNVPSATRIVMRYNLLSQEPAEIINSLGETCRLNIEDNGILERCVWRAQVQALFHLIEEKRIMIVEAYRSDILSLLPQMDAFRNTINEPDDVELGLLTYLLRNDVSAGRLRLSTQAEEDYVFELHEYRNKLAHQQPLTLHQVKRILA